MNNVTGKKYYKAENILTPKMVIDNVRLNSENGQIKKGSWIEDMCDVSKSFYKQIDSKWYDNNDIDSDDDEDDIKSYASDESEKQK